MHDDPHFDEFSGSHMNDSPIEVQVRVFSSTATAIPASAVDNRTADTRDDHQRRGSQQTL